MHLELSGAGKVSFAGSQQQWSEGRDSNPAVMQVAAFAGHEMRVIEVMPCCFELHFLGFKTGGYRTIEEAKASAPSFARKVLARLIEMIAD